VSIYGASGGTSGAAAHVSGVTALMMSNWNSSTPSWDNIVQEDCEAILKLTATDLAQAFPYGETVGPDAKTGYGRINAGLAVMAVDQGYHIRHIDKTHYTNSHSTSTTLQQACATWQWTGSNTSNVPAAFYTTDIYEVETIYNYNYSSETLIDSWELYKASTGYPLMAGCILHQDEDAFVELKNKATLTACTLKTYVYNFTYDMTNSKTVNYWIPCHPSQVNSAFTLYTVNPFAQTAIQKQNAEVDYINIYPNPGTGKFTIGYKSMKECKSVVTVTDCTGRIIQEQEIRTNSGINRQEVDLSVNPDGIYFIKFELQDNRTFVRKIVLAH